MSRRFWIIGGEYTDTRFDRLVDGTQQVEGPFPCRDSALRAWRRLADETRANAHARYVLAEEPAAAG